jgi:short chain dehydrogenase
MIDRGGGGAIVNIASMAGVSGAPNMPAYSASKAAVVGLTKAAAKDLAPHAIRVNAVSPGFVGPGRMWETQVAAQASAKSQYYDDDPKRVAQQMIGLVPLRRRARSRPSSSSCCRMPPRTSRASTSRSLAEASSPPPRPCGRTSATSFPQRSRSTDDMMFGRLGKLVIATLGLSFCFLLNAGTFVFIVVMLLAMRTDELSP